MNYFERMQAAVNYIEDCVDHHIDVKAGDIANHVFISISHFYVLFQSILGVTVKDYIRQRRLSNAAVELLSTRKKILQIAQEAGYESQEAFTRAFVRSFDITPGGLRKAQNSIELYEKRKVLNVAESPLKEDKRFRLRFMAESGIKVIGMELFTNYHDALYNASIIRFDADMFLPRASEIQGVLNKCSYMGIIKSPSEDSIHDFSGFRVSEIHNIPHNMMAVVLPPSKYALFTYEGIINPTIDNEMKRYVFGHWLPTSGYEWSEDYIINEFHFNQTISDEAFESFNLLVPIR